MAFQTFINGVPELSRNCKKLECLKVDILVLMGSSRRNSRIKFYLSTLRIFGCITDWCNNSWPVTIYSDHDNINGEKYLGPRYEEADYRVNPNCRVTEIDFIRYVVDVAGCYLARHHGEKFLPKLKYAAGLDVTDPEHTNHLTEPDL